MQLRRRKSKKEGKREGEPKYKERKKERKKEEKKEEPNRLSSLALGGEENIQREKTEHERFSLSHIPSI